MANQLIEAGKLADVLEKVYNQGCDHSLISRAWDDGLIDNNEKDKLHFWLEQGDEDGNDYQIYQEENNRLSNEAVGAQEGR